MSSSQTFPILASTIDEAQMCVDATSGAVCTQWYNENSYAYSDPYMTPYPSATVDNHTWPQYVAPQIPHMNMNSYGMRTENQQIQAQTNSSQRPRNSPSNLALSSDALSWPANGLGIQYTTPSANTIPTPPVSSTFAPSMSYAASAVGPTPPVSSTFPPTSFSASVGAPTPVSSTFPPLAFSASAGVPTPPVTSTFPPHSFQGYTTGEMFNISSPELRQAQSRRSYASIAPNPSPAPEKRKRDDDEPEFIGESSKSKRRKRTSSAASASLKDEDRLLIQLKEEENLPWKELIVRFKAETDKARTVASLQMRYKRLRDKHRVWEDYEIEALKKAHEYWETCKWDIISAKMLDYGVKEKFPPRHCGRKFQDLEKPLGSQSHFHTPTSASQLSSPVEGHFHSWMTTSAA